MNRLTVSMIFLTRSCLSTQEFRRFSGDIGAGFTQPVGSNTGRNLDVAWNVQGGFGLNFTPYLGAKNDLAYNHFDLSSFALNSVGVLAGDVQIFSATLNPVVHLNPTGNFDVYLTGGGGVHHWFQEFTQPAVATFRVQSVFRLLSRCCRCKSSSGARIQ